MKPALFDTRSVLYGAILSIFAISAAFATPSEPLYIDDISDNIGMVDLSTGIVTVLGNDGGVGLTDIGFTSDGNLYGTSFGAFYSVSKTTGAATFISNYDAFGFNALIGAGHGTLYAADVYGDTLYSITVSPFTVTQFTGSTGGDSAGDLAFSPTGTLYETMTDGDLAALTVSGNTVSSVIAGNMGLDDVFGLATGDDSTTYAIEGTTIYTVDLATGVLTPLLDYSGHGLGQANGAAFPDESLLKLPSQPTGLVATAGNAQVVLSWVSTSAATSFNLYRGTVSGGEGGAAFATGITTNSYTDTGLTNGVTYYYTMKAVDNFGTSRLSNEVRATPAVPSTHVLWSNASGAVSLWNYDPPTGTFTQNSFGPYSGWTALAIADGPDGLTRLLWFNRTSYVAALWGVNGATGAITQTSFGPFPGWVPTAVSVDAHNTTHLLWTSAKGAASIWNLPTIQGTYTQRTYGPYDGWTATAMGDGPDGNTRLIWTNLDDTASVWSVDTVTSTFSQNTFGPFDWWTPVAISVNGDETTHVLWTYQLGAVSLWNLDALTGTFTQNGFGPYSGWTAASIADGADGNTQVLWDNVTGAASIWDLDNVTGAYTQHSFGPYTDWTATAISGQP